MSVAQGRFAIQLFLCPDVDSVGLTAIAFGDQNSFEKCNRIFAPDSPIEFQGEWEKTPGLEVMKRFERGR